MKLSIITVNLNNTAGLRKTIESVVSQSFTDFEFLVIDGASTDGSVEVIKDFTGEFTYWISEPDKGHFYAMNKGIHQAKGEYCLFLNSGDFLVSPDVLQQAFKTSFSEDIVVGDCNVSQQNVVIFKAVPPEQISFSSFYGRTLPHQSSFFRLDLFKKLGCYSEQYKLASDFEFFIRALIVNNCTYRHISVTISDFNLEGLSNNPKFDSAYKAEYESILKSLIGPHIISDYAAWEKERNEMNVFYWVKTKPVLYKSLNWIFLLATILVTMKKRIFKKKKPEYNC